MVHDSSGSLFGTTVSTGGGGITGASTSTGSYSDSGADSSVICSALRVVDRVAMYAI